MPSGHLASRCQAEGGLGLAPSCPALSPSARSDHSRIVAGRVRRRRLLLGATAAGILVALALPWGGAGGHPLATPGPVLAGAAVTAGADYVVQPGDTMWSIARRLDPGADPRVIVAQLEAQVGSDSLQAGERIHLP
jgi:hypothetical protein